MTDFLWAEFVCVLQCPPAREWDDFDRRGFIGERGLIKGLAREGQGEIVSDTQIMRSRSCVLQWNTAIRPMLKIVPKGTICICH